MKKVTEREKAELLHGVASSQHLQDIARRLCAEHDTARRPVANGLGSLSPQELVRMRQSLHTVSKRAPIEHMKSLCALLNEIDAELERR